MNWQNNSNWLEGKIGHKGGGGGEAAARPTLLLPSFIPGSARAAFDEKAEKSILQNNQKRSLHAIMTL